MHCAFADAYGSDPGFRHTIPRRPRGWRSDRLRAPARRPHKFLESLGSDYVLACAIDQFAFSVGVSYDLRKYRERPILRSQSWSPMSTVTQGGHGDHSSGGEPLRGISPGSQRK
jgi:hypothetical protein